MSTITLRGEGPWGEKLVRKKKKGPGRRATSTELAGASTRSGIKKKREHLSERKK